MTPNIAKSHKDTAKFADTPTAEDLQRSGNAPKMDGDHSAKTMDAGAMSAAAGTDMTEGLHETAKQGVSVLGRTPRTKMELWTVNFVLTASQGRSRNEGDRRWDVNLQCGRRCCWKCFH